MEPRSEKQPDENTRTSDEREREQSRTAMAAAEQRIRAHRRREFQRQWAPQFVAATIGTGEGGPEIVQAALIVAGAIFDATEDPDDDAPADTCVLSARDAGACLTHGPDCRRARLVR